MRAVVEPGQEDPLSGLPTSGKPSSNLINRVRTAILISVPAFLALIATAEWPIYVLTVLVAIFSALELSKLYSLKSPWLPILGLLGVTGVVLKLTRVDKVPYAALAALAIGSIAVYARGRRGSNSLLDILTIGWIAGPIACALWLHQVSLDPTRLFSPNLLVLVALPLWIGDTCGYFFGKAFGKRLLAPKISPKKTWVGAVANFFGCVATALIVGAIMESTMSDSLPLTASLGVGVVTGVLGQAGDLLQSFLKRSFDAKDSGTILPGHGGVLDRIDSFLLASVPACITLWNLAPGLFQHKP